jgi:predicted dehydrogenase
MKKGKHVIVEKPMALSTTDANEMIETAKANNVKLCVSHQNRFNLPIQKLRRAIEDGSFGKIISGNARVLWNRGAEYYDQAPWRGTYEQDGGCLMNQCIHNIDLLQWMLGEEIEWIHAEVGNFIHPYIEAEDYGSIQIKFKNGAIGNVEGTVCVYPRNLEETLSIIGEKGTAVISGLAVNKIQTWRFEDGDEAEKLVMAECNREIDSVYGEGHSALYADMISAIKNKREPYINGEKGKKAMGIILAAYKSSEEGKRVNFPIENIKSTDFKKENQI